MTYPASRSLIILTYKIRNPHFLVLSVSDQGSPGEAASSGRPSRHRRTPLGTLYRHIPTPILRPLSSRCTPRQSSSSCTPRGSRREGSCQAGAPIPGTKSISISITETGCRICRTHRLLRDNTLEGDGLHGGLLLRSRSGRHFES
jgi:hypothetical protein